MLLKREIGPAHTVAAVSELPIHDRVGLSIEARDSLDALARIREAESAGVRQVWMVIGGPGRADSLTVYAAAAAQTSRIKLGTSIVPIYPRHPLVMAQQALAVDDIAPGRFRLGVGPSHRHVIEQKYGIPMTLPLAYLKEYVLIVRGALWNGTINHHGKFFNVKYDLPRKAKVPLLVSALGERAFELAGEISDGAISWMCPAPYLLSKAIPALRAGAKAQNRPPPPVVAHTLVAMSTDKTAVLSAARRKVQGYVNVPFYAHMFAKAGIPVGANGSGSDTLANALVVDGNDSKIRERLLELLSSGLDELLIAHLTVADEESERKRLLRLIGSL